ncbi:MAG: hypothetical protein IJT38_06130 [Clostridia bacterium]|nr:hypothetical protein [Clostridia bacterium]
MPLSPEDMLKNVMNDPEAMEKINSFLSSMGKDEESESSNLGISPEMLAKATQMMSQMSNADDKGVSLILALKPYLSDRRIESADMAIKFLKLSKLSSLMGNLDL